MSKINNNLISIFTILAFVFGVFLALPVNAQNRTGVLPFPYTPIQNINTYYTVPHISANNQLVIPGCEGRNTGFSYTVQGQSCAGNYIGNQNTNTTTNESSVNRNTTTNTVYKNTSYEDTSKTNQENTNTVSDINQNKQTLSEEDSFSNLTANALVGSNSFMPSGLLQWIFLIIIITAIIFLWRYVNAEEKYLKEPLKHA